MVELLKHLGSNIKFDLNKKNFIHNQNQKLKTTAPYKLLKTMRAESLCLVHFYQGLKKLKCLYRGCAIGSRPVDIHLFVLKKLGAKIKLKMAIF